MRRRANPDAQHVQLYHWMIKSPAWAALSGNEVKVLIDLWHYHSGVNNGRISYSCKQAGAAINATKMTGARALQTLVQLGFLRITQEAVFRSRDACLYRLTTVPVGKEPATKEFLKLTTGDIAKIRAEDRAKNRSVVTRMLLHSNMGVTAKVVPFKAANKIKGIERGVGERKNGPSPTPLKTAKKPIKPA